MIKYTPNESLFVEQVLEDVAYFFQQALVDSSIDTSDFEYIKEVSTALIIVKAANMNYEFSEADLEENNEPTGSVS